MIMLVQRQIRVINIEKTQENVIMDFNKIPSVYNRFIFDDKIKLSDLNYKKLISQYYWLLKLRG